MIFVGHERGIWRWHLSRATSRIDREIIIIALPIRACLRRLKRRQNACIGRLKANLKGVLAGIVKW